MLAQEPVRTTGGQVRIVDSSNFPAATTVTAALVEINPGGLRELHWHLNADEWQYYISGRGRMTVFASGGWARTFDYQANRRKPGPPHRVRESCHCRWSWLLLGVHSRIMGSRDGHLDDLTRCVFRTNHASNYPPLAGTFSRDKAQGISYQ